MNKKIVSSATDNTVLKLKVLAKKKEGVRNKLAVTAKRLALLAKKKESIRSKLEITAKKFATIAKEKEEVRNKLAVTAKKLARTAKEAESVRRRLVSTVKEKEQVRSNLAVVAKKLAVTAKEREIVRRRLVVTAKRLNDKAIKLAIVAKEKESNRRELARTAEKLAATAKEVALANQELRSLDLAKDEFVSIASHQLRTPLTALKGYVGMLLDGDAGQMNDKQRRYLEEIKNANDRMILLITALLNVSRVDLDVFIVEPEQVELKKVVASALSDFEIKIKEKKLQVETIFAKDVSAIFADLNILRMIFQNLFSNAVKYTPAGGKIIISIKKEAPNMLISVSDTGYGIPNDVQAKIFTKMFRADNARLKDPEGTGLGLYIIKTTLEKTGGKIWFESVENKGSTFYVTIPLAGMKKKIGTKRLELK